MMEIPLRITATDIPAIVSYGPQGIYGIAVAHIAMVEYKDRLLKLHTSAGEIFFPEDNSIEGCLRSLEPYFSAVVFRIQEQRAKEKQNDADNG